MRLTVRTSNLPLARHHDPHRQAEHLSREGVPTWSRTAPAGCGDGERLFHRDMTSLNLIPEADLGQEQAGKALMAVRKKGDIREGHQTACSAFHRIRNRCRKKFCAKRSWSKRAAHIGQVDGFAVMQVSDSPSNIHNRITAPSIRVRRRSSMWRESRAPAHLHSKDILMLPVPRSALRTPLSLSAAPAWTILVDVDSDSASAVPALHVAAFGSCQDPADAITAMTRSLSSIGRIQAVGGVNQEWKAWPM